MAVVHPIRQPRPEPVEMRDRALDNLRYIRFAMERAGSFTAVPGLGGIALGTTALIVAVLARGMRNPHVWLAAWLGEAVLACLIGVAAAAHKSHKAGMPLLSGPGRKFLASFAPPLLAGALLTMVLFRAGFSRSSARRLAAALWRRGALRRRRIRESRPGHGHLLYGHRGGRAVRPPAPGETCFWLPVSAVCISLLAF